MHVAFLIPMIDRIGGAEQQVLLLAQGLACRNWNVSLIALSGTGGEAVASLLQQGIVYRSLHMRKGLSDPRGWIHLHCWLRRHQPDVLHAHLPHAGPMARFSRFAAPIRVMVETIHSPATGGSLCRSAYHFSSSQPDVVAAVSRTAAEPWLTQRMVREEQLALIPNGIDPNHWKRDPDVRHAVRNRLGLRDEFMWLAVGRLHPVKDHATLLRAFAMLSVDARLVIAGAGPRETALKRQAVALGIESKLHFLGFQRDVLPWMQAADALVLSSRWEGLPMAVLEASSCELPVVSTDVPAMRELFPDHYRCPAVAVGDSVAMATAMKQIMQLPEPQRDRLGRTAREDIARRFSLASVLDQWEETYCRLLAAKSYPTRSGLVASVLRGRTLQPQ